MPTVVRIGIAVVICPAIAFMGFASYCMNAHPVPTSQLDLVVDGMPSGHVERLLGRPTGINTSGDGADSWVFSSPFVWCYVTVRFSPQGEVVGIDHDH